MIAARKNSKHITKLRGVFLPFLIVMLFASNAIATPINYTFTGKVTGTAWLDFMQPDGSTKAVISYDLTFASPGPGGGFNHTDADPVSEITRTLSGGDDFITIKSGANDIRLGFTGLIITIWNDPRNDYFAERIVNGGSVTSGVGTYSPVPEPSTLFLLSGGLLGLGGYRWRQLRREGTQVA